MERKVADMEDARNLPIVLRPFRNKIEVCYSSGEGLIKLCGLDMYMDRTNGEYIFRKPSESKTDIVYSR